MFEAWSLLNHHPPGCFLCNISPLIASLYMLLDEYRPHAFMYKRTVDDLSTPWVPSPITPARQLPPTTVGSPVSLLSSTLSTTRSPERTKKVLQFDIPDSEVSSRASTERRKQSHMSFFRSVKRKLLSKYQSLATCMRFYLHLTTAGDTYHL